MDVDTDTKVLVPRAPLMEVVDLDTNVLYYRGPWMEVVDIDTNVLWGTTFRTPIRTLVNRALFFPFS